MALVFVLLVIFYNLFKRLQTKVSSKTIIGKNNMQLCEAEQFIFLLYKGACWLL